MSIFIPEHQGKLRLDLADETFIGALFNVPVPKFVTRDKTDLLELIQDYGWEITEYAKKS